MLGAGQYISRTVMSGVGGGGVIPISDFIRLTGTLYMYALRAFL